MLNINTKTQIIVEDITLKLTVGQATVLATILSNIGGDRSGLRGAVQEIYNELLEVGVRYLGTSSASGTIHLYGTLEERKAEIDANKTRIAEYVASIPKTLEDIKLNTYLSKSNRIAAIKELREIALKHGLSAGLKEAKDEVDRRMADIW